MEKQYNKDVVYLYLTFFIYIFSVRYQYLASLYGIVAIPFYYLQKRHNTNHVLSVLFIILINTILIPIVGVSWREMCLLFWFLISILIIGNSDIKIERFVSFVNCSYIVYLILSVLVSFHYINAGFDPNHEQLNQFDVESYGGIFQTLVGYSGSTANIDSYSLIVFSVNLMYGGEKKTFMCIISSLAFIATLRLTPLVSIIVAAIIVLLNNKTYLKISRLSIISFLPLSFLTPLFVVKNFDALNSFTHSRAGIWIQYLKILGNNDLAFWLGFRQKQLPLVHGSIYMDDFANPHSTYLRILLFWGIIFFSIFMFYLLNRYIHLSSRKDIFITSVILVSGMTNQDILWNENPTYILILLYFFHRGNFKTNIANRVVHDYRN